MDIQQLDTYMPKKARHVVGAHARYKVLYGGRGGGKSYAFADGLIVQALHFPVRILCTREMQNSIRDSVHRLLRDRIYALGLDKFFVINRENIYSQAGAEFIFKGLHHNISDIKSTEGIDICWVEEAEKVSDDSWTILIPTIRKENSEIWVSFNPEDENSSTYQRFVVNPPDDCVRDEINYIDNRYFPEVLRREMEYDKRVDFDKYEHVWLGKIKKYSETCIFKGKVEIEDFEYPDEGTQFFYGVDFGFSVDPTAVGRMFVKDRKLYICDEAYGHGVELDDLHQFFASVPGISDGWQIYGDSARPDTISYLTRPLEAKNGTTYSGYNIIGAEKGKGSVEDGIQFLRGFEKIIIHPRCTGAQGDFQNYRWKTDKITGAILPIPAEKSDHWPDLARYALEPYIKAKVSIFDVF